MSDRKQTKLPSLHEKRLRDTILAEAYRTITVQDAGRAVTIPIAQAVIRANAVNAAKGQHRAQRLFSELPSSTKTARKQLNDAYFHSALIYRIERDRELDRRAKAEITSLPEPSPHPDQNVLNMSEGTVSVKGPWTKEYKAFLDRRAARKPEIVRAVAQLKLDLETESRSR